MFFEALAINKPVIVVSKLKYNAQVLYVHIFLYFATELTNHTLKTNQMWEP